MQIIVFAPHPDDELIGCGGTMAKHLQQGHKVSIVYMSSGDAGTMKHGKRKMTLIREEEAQKAAVLLGITDLHFLRNPDGYIEFSRDNIIKIVSLLRDKQPDSVYIPHRRDAVKDHAVTHELLVEACRRASGPWFQECEGEPWAVENILAYEVGTPLQEVSCTEDISQFMQVKLDALQLHRSQLEAIRYDEAVKALNRYRGIMSGQGDYCECFQLIKARLPGLRN